MMSVNTLNDLLHCVVFYSPCILQVFLNTFFTCSLFFPADFDPSLGMMTGIAPMNPLMPGLGIVPPPISQDLPIVKEIIHCKSCTLFPPNPSESTATSSKILFHNLHLTAWLEFMPQYALFSVLMHFKARY